MPKVTSETWEIKNSFLFIKGNICLKQKVKTILYLYPSSSEQRPEYFRENTNGSWF